MLSLLLDLFTDGKTDFPTLWYTSTSEVPTLSCTRKKVPFSVEASPHNQATVESTPPPRPARDDNEVFYFTVRPVLEST